MLSGFGALAISYTPSALPSTYISPQNQVDAFDEPALVVLGVCLNGILAVYLNTVLDLAAKAQFSDESNTLFSLGISSSISRSTPTPFKVERRILHECSSQQVSKPIYL